MHCPGSEVRIVWGLEPPTAHPGDPLNHDSVQNHSESSGPHYGFTTAPPGVPGAWCTPGVVPGGLESRPKWLGTNPAGAGAHLGSPGRVTGLWGEQGCETRLRGAFRSRSCLQAKPQVWALRQGPALASGKKPGWPKTGRSGRAGIASAHPGSQGHGVKGPPYPEPGPHTPL